MINEKERLKRRLKTDSVQALQTTLNVTVSSEELTWLTNPSRHNENYENSETRLNKQEKTLKNRLKTSLEKGETYKPRVAETVTKEMRTGGLK